MKFMTALFLLAFLATFSIHSHAQERAVMPDRQSVEISGQISALKSLIQALAQQVQDAQASLTALEPLSMSMSSSLTALQNNLNGGGIAQLTEINSYTGTMRIVGRDYSGSHEFCDVQIRTPQVNFSKRSPVEFDYDDNACKSWAYSYFLEQMTARYPASFQPISGGETTYRYNMIETKIVQIDYDN